MWHHWQETEEGVRTMPVSEMVRKLYPLFRPYMKLIGLALLLLLVITATSIAGPYILGILIIDNYLADGNLTAVIWAGCIYLGITILGTILGFYQAVLLFRVGILMITDFKDKMLRHILNLGLDFFNEHPPGKLISRVEADADTVRNLFGEVLVNLLRNLFLVVGFYAVMFFVNWKLTLYVAVLIPVLFGAVFVFLRAIRRNYKELRAQWAIVTGYTTEYVQGVDVIQQYNYEKHAKHRMHQVNLGKYRIDVLTAFLEYGFWGGFVFGEVVAYAIVIIMGARDVIAGDAGTHSMITIGTIVLFFEYIRNMFFPIIQVGEQLNFIQKAFVSTERIFNILETKPAIVDGELTSEELTFDSEIAFENVWFAYEEDNWVLKDVSFKLPKGNRLALVGASGGGKSTIINLLLRFYDPQKGRITVDGVDIRDLPFKAWRGLMGLVLQDIYLFPGTVKDNLRVFNDDVDLDTIKRVSEIVRANRFIERLPDGYDGELAERGANLSVGERQLLSFARALTFDPPLLVLDEATSSVDPHTERLVQEAIERLLEGRTSVIVAHRLSTILGSDEILLIQDGKVAEHGTHRELIAQDGLYAKLYMLQYAEMEGGG